MNIQELSQFNNACDELVSGKYILFDIKIGSILNIIANDEKLTNIVNSCLNNYDFVSEFKALSYEIENGIQLKLPTNDKEVIAFIYTLLYKLKNADINFYEFLKTYYNSQFEMFATSTITPFKNAMNSIYSKRHILVETTDYQNNYYNKIMTTIKLIMKNLDAYKLNMNQKEEFTMLLNSLYLASEKNDKKLVFSLMIGLDYFTKSNKKSRNAYLMLEECFERQ